MDAERLGWTCACILGMLFPAQFEEVISRCYMGMNINQQATWMSCSRGNVLKLYKKARRNLKIIKRFITEAVNCDN